MYFHIQIRIKFVSGSRSEWFLQKVNSWFFSKIKTSCLPGTIGGRYLFYFLFVKQVYTVGSFFRRSWIRIAFKSQQGLDQNSDLGVGSGFLNNNYGTNYQHWPQEQYPYFNIYRTSYHPRILKLLYFLYLIFRGWLGYELPFDRHDWIIDRCGKEVR